MSRVHPVKKRLLTGIVWALPAVLAAADLTIRSHEGGIRDGKQWGETYTEYFSAQGLRIDVQTDGEPSPGMYFLLVRDPDRLFIVRGTSVTAVDRATLESLEAKHGAPARSTAHLTPVGSSHSLNGFSCTGFRLRRPGLPTRFACLASPDSLGLSAAYVEASRDLRDVLGRVMNASGAATGASRKGAASRAPFNFYGLAEGYPVHLWESPKGDVTWESQLLSITPGPVSPDLFRPPAPGR
jgi:hypothetical protein